MSTVGTSPHGDTGHWKTDRWLRETGTVKMKSRRFRTRESRGAEVLHWYWVLGEPGAVSTWFSDTRPITGRVTCSGLAWHSARPWRDGDEHYPCEFLEGHCWVTCGTMLGLQPYCDAFVSGDEELIYAWLEGGLAGLAEEVRGEG